jgi:hypothetical protein
VSPLLCTLIIKTSRVQNTNIAKRNWILYEERTRKQLQSLEKS